MSIQVKDANGTIQTVNTLPDEGQADAAASLPVVLASDAPLPAGTNLIGKIGVVPAASGVAAIVGTFTGTGTSAAFTPVAGKGIWVALQGSWVGTVIVERSIDGGTTWLPLTAAGSPFGSFGANAQEVIGQEDDPGAATYRLHCTAFTSGTITYRLGHS